MLFENVTAKVAIVILPKYLSELHKVLGDRRLIIGGQVDRRHKIAVVLPDPAGHLELKSSRFVLAAVNTGHSLGLLKVIPDGLIVGMVPNRVQHLFVLLHAQRQRLMASAHRPIVVIQNGHLLVRVKIGRLVPGFLSTLSYRGQELQDGFGGGFKVEALLRGKHRIDALAQLIGLWRLHVVDVVPIFIR
jgi:hypothetical protein